MKRFLLIAASLVSALALAADANIGNYTKVRTQSWTVANALAVNAAALTATSGIDYNSGGAVAGAICAESGQTITSGNVRAYVYTPISETPSGTDPVTYAWVQYNALDQALSPGVRCTVTGDKQSFTGLGRIAWVEDDVVVSGGTTITVTYLRRNAQPKIGQ